MDPSVFFGRGRVTRQRPQPKPLSSWEQNVDREVSPAVKDSKKTNVKSSDVVKPSEGKGRNVSKKTIAAKNSEPRGRKPAKDRSCGNIKPKKTAGKKAEIEPVEVDVDKIGPVYQNVRRSDVIGDPTNEYDFLVDENSLSLKKKRAPRKKKDPAQKGTDNWRGIVKWDPSKRPIKIKPISSKGLKSKGTQVPKLNAGSTIPKTVSSKEAITSKESTLNKCHPPTMNAQKSVPGVKSVSNIEVLKKNALALSSAKRTSSPLCMAAIQMTSTPKITANASAMQKASPQSAPKESPVSRIASNVQASPNLEQMIGQAVTPTGSNSTIDLHRGSSVIASRTPERVPEVNVNTSNIAASCSKNASTPVIHSTSTAKSSTAKPTPAVHSSASSLSRSSVTCSPVPVSSTPARPLWACALDESEIDLDFDDTSLPTRMFSTHRGTMPAPVHDSNVTKRKPPKFSPEKSQLVPKASAVKFSSPQSSTDTVEEHTASKAAECLTVENCFGFEDDDDTPISQQSARSCRMPVIITQVQKRKGTPRETSRHSIERVKALLRGEIQARTPRSISKTPVTPTPGSIQTKLTDYVCSTPTSSPVSSTKSASPVLLTPSLVPLFGEEQLDKELASPYVQPLRRSYDRSLPVKRIACGDEVLSDDETGEGHEKALAESIAPLKKKSRSYKKKKKPQDLQLDQWANNLASHFDELEEIELEVE